MLAVLKDLEPERARQVLAAAADRILPKPLPELSGAARSATQELAQQVIDELSENFRTASADQRRVQLYESLSKELSNAILGGIDQSALRSSIGEKGLLSAAHYQITFSPKFNARMQLWSVRRNHAENAIRSAEMVQHLEATTPDSTHTPLVSLFVQTPQVQWPQYSIFVKCERHGSSLMVDDAVRIYHDEIDLVGATTPTDVLGRFLSKFGVDIEISGRVKRLFVSEVFETMPGESVVVRMADGSKVDWRNDGPKKDNFEIIIGYTISDAAYVEQLRRHGVKVQAPQGSALGVSTRSK